MTPIRNGIESVLSEHLPAMVTKSLIERLPPTAMAAYPGELDVVTMYALLSHLEGGLKLFGAKAPTQALERLRAALTGGRPVPASTESIPIRGEQDVLLVQRRCRGLVQKCFSATDTVRLVTAVSELARNIYLYAGKGEIDLSVAETSRGVRFSVVARDDGPGIPHLESVMSGSYVSRTGLGKGLRGVKELLEDMHVETAPGKGTLVRGNKFGRRK